MSSPFIPLHQIYSHNFIFPCIFLLQPQSDSVMRFLTIFGVLKRFDLGPHMNRRKQFRELFLFRRIRVSAWSTTTRTLCQHSQQLRRHCVSVVKDYADTQEIISLWKYLCENEKFRETVFACSYSAQVESFRPKNGHKSRDTVPLPLFSSCVIVSLVSSLIRAANVFAFFKSNTTAFSDALCKYVSVLKTTRTRKTQRVTDEKTNVF